MIFYAHDFIRLELFEELGWILKKIGFLGGMLLSDEKARWNLVSYLEVDDAASTFSLN